MDQTSEIKQALLLGTIEDIHVQVLIDALVAADDLYFNDDESFLSDAEYDAIKQYAQRTNPTEPYFTGIGSSVRGGKVVLPNKMGSLDQIYQGEYRPWVEKHNLTKETLVVSDKLDGVSSQLIYGRDGKLQIAYSRGDGTLGADISRHIRKIKSVPQQIDTKGEIVAIRAEVILAPAKFNILKTKVKSKSGKTYKNPRNMVAGCMNSSERPDVVYEYLDVVAYQVIGSTLSKSDQFKWLAKQGLKTAYYTTMIAGKIDEAILTKHLNDRRAVTEYEIDGVVIDVDDANTRKRINPTRETLNPAYAVKFKVADDSNQATTTVTNVEWNISKDGYFKPRVQFNPVNLVGVTISNASGFNAKFIKDNMIGPGAVIRITRSGDVIPYILGVDTPATEPQLPDDAVWNATGVDLLVADENNPTMRLQQLTDFFNTLDIPHLADGNIEKLFDCGFTTPESIIPLTQEDFGSVVGSLSNGKKIFTGIRAKFTNIELYRLMGAHPAFGRGVGVRKMKKLWDAFAGDMTKCSDTNAIVAVEGFDIKTAKKIVNGVERFNAFMDEVRDYVTVAPYVAPVQGGLSGSTFVFTGFRSKELEQAIEAAGGKMGSSVSSKTTYLVTEDPDSNSGKAKKARELGVAVIGVQALRDMLA